MLRIWWCQFCQHYEMKALLSACQCRAYVPAQQHAQHEAEAGWISEDILLLGSGHAGNNIPPSSVFFHNAVHSFSNIFIQHLMKWDLICWDLSEKKGINHNMWVCLGITYTYLKNNYNSRPNILENRWMEDIIWQEQGFIKKK